MNKFSLVEKIKNRVTMVSQFQLFTRCGLLNTRTVRQTQYTTPADNTPRKTSEVIYIAEIFLGVFIFSTKMRNVINTKSSKTIIYQSKFIIQGSKINIFFTLNTFKISNLN